MAWKYRQRYPQDGEILNPEDWNLNHQEYADEFNGFLDRDNLPINAIDEGRTEDYAMNRVHNDSYTDSTPWVGAERTAAWRNTDSTGAVSLGSVEIDCPVDCLLICSYNATWATTLASGNGDIRFRVTVDGVSVAESHFISGWFLEWGVHVEGAVPVAAGKHTIRAEAQIATQDQTSEGAQKYTSSERQVTVYERELVVRERRR